MIFQFKNFVPTIDSSSYIHPQANVTGNVEIGKNVYVGPGAVLRGDWGKIVVENGCNIQENCIIHMFPRTTVRIYEGAHLGHGCTIHGATIGKNSLIGINAVVLDDAEIGNECIVGALTLVKSEMKVPNRKIIVGNPGKIIKNVSDEMLNWKIEGTKIYQQLPKDCMNSLNECSPSRAKANYTNKKVNYKTWKKTKK